MNKFQANVVYPDGKVKEVKNLGYMLRNWSMITDIHVTSFEGAVDADAFVSVDFKDGRTYTTGYMDKGILRRFLDRPVFRGLTCNWFGTDETIEKGW